MPVLRDTLHASTTYFKKCAHLAANLLMYLYHQELTVYYFEVMRIAARRI